MKIRAFVVPPPPEACMEFETQLEGCCCCCEQGGSKKHFFVDIGSNFFF